MLNTNTPRLYTLHARPNENERPEASSEPTNPANVAFTSRQLGHASVSSTLNVYTHLFDHVEHAATVMERLEGRFGETLRPVDLSPRAGQGPHERGGAR